MALPLPPSPCFSSAGEVPANDQQVAVKLYINLPKVEIILSRFYFIMKLYCIICIYMSEYTESLHYDEQICLSEVDEVAQMRTELV